VHLEEDAEVITRACICDREMATSLACGIESEVDLCAMLFHMAVQGTSVTCPSMQDIVPGQHGDYLRLRVASHVASSVSDCSYL
jgi:hypothetical protein